LPTHLVPTGVLTLDRLPLTTNGKLDHAALPAPDFGAATTPFRAPATPREDVLCGLFAEVLDVPRVGVDDNFFDLGGHSLLATRLISRVRSALGTELAIRVLFEAPTVAALAERLPDAGRERPALRPESRPDILPLASAQRRLWFLDRLQGPNATYNIPLALRLSGPLDREAVEHAVNDVIARHESLRTVFPETDGTPRQRVLDPARARTAVPVSTTTEARLVDDLGAAARHRFALATEIPLRARLFALDDTEHVLLLLMHHIAGDGWSAAPLARDLARAYEARCAGRAPDWAALPAQYADYTLWQRRLLGDERDPESLAARQLAYWRQALDGIRERLDLPADRPHPPVARYRGASVPYSIEPGLHAALRTLARDSGASVFMVLHAALAALLGRLGGDDDIAIGSPIAGRTDPALDELVGFFVNTLVLRTDTSGDPTFRELLARVRSTVLSAYEHQDVPFERLVEILNPARSTAHNPLFQVMLAFQNLPEPDLRMPGLAVRIQHIPVETAKFDLHLELTDLHVEGLSGERDPDSGVASIDGAVHYNTDIFDRGTVETLLDRLTLTLRACVADPDRPIGTVEILTPEERHHLLAGVNDTAHPVADVTLDELFERSAERNPDAVAVVFDGQEVTYGELDARADGLARELTARGVRPESVVAVVLPRSVELVVALLAVVKAGGAYLPVDPAHPADRIVFVLADAEPVCAVVGAGGADVLPDGIPTVPVDAAGPPDRHPVRPHPLNPAYVIHTSGSTGRPKGVVVHHRAIVNRLRWMQAEYRLDPDDRVLQKTPAGFDVSVWEFFWPLAEGATLVVARPDGHRDPRYLARVIRDERVTTIHFVPSMLRAFLQEPAATACTGLRRVLCSGEALPPELVDQHRETLPTVPLHNLYGPTETAVDVTSWAVPGEGDLAGASGVPIGRPVWNTRLHVLDAGLRPVPVGVVGELYVGGVQ
ncbi:condensation domain-containing protein, partial [Streptomyces hainanensis]